MSHHTKHCSKKSPSTHHRFPIMRFIREHILHHQIPLNLNWMWNFGSMATFVFIIMMMTGIFLAMFYTAHVDYAFDSIQNIMRHIRWGWMMRFIHINGATLFFVALYAHIARGLYYASYKSPCEATWIFGMIIFVMVMISAFTGNVLPWGQINYWSATVIINLCSVIPFAGDFLQKWICGGSFVQNATLHRFFIVHFLMPFAMLILIIFHLIALRLHGSSHPQGRHPVRKIPFHPYYTVKDILGICILMLIWGFLTFFASDFFTECSENYTRANLHITPSHIIPAWYFRPFYAILCTVPSKIFGVILMIGSILILFIVPWLDRSHVYAPRQRFLYRWMCRGLGICFLTLIWTGSHAPDGTLLFISRCATAYYFIYFLAGMPIVSYVERKKMRTESKV